MNNIGELQARFSDLLNYDSDDISSPIDPLTWRSPEGDACLHYAAMRGDDHAIRLLIELGVDPNLRGDMNRTALHYARSNGHVTTANTLVECGADDSILDEFGKHA